MSSLTFEEVLDRLGVSYRMEMRGTVRMIPRRGSHWTLTQRRDRLRTPVRYAPHLVVMG